MIRCRRERKEGEGRAPEPARPNARTNSQDARPRRGKSGWKSRLKFRFNVVNPALLNKSAKFSVAESSFSPRLPSCRQVSTQKNRGLQCRFCGFLVAFSRTSSSLFTSSGSGCMPATERASEWLPPCAFPSLSHVGGAETAPILSNISKFSEGVEGRWKE